MAARVIDTDLGTLIQAMALEPGANSMVMLDVESNNPSLSDLKRIRVFDFAYGAFNPFTGTSGKIKSDLVYEGMIHPGVIEQIIRWKKIKDVALDSYYGFFKLLMEHDWWSDRVISKEEISNEALGKFKNDMRQKLYITQQVTLPAHEKALLGWRGERSHYKNAAKQAANREKDISKAKKTIEDLNKWISMDNDLDTAIQSGDLLGNSTYDSIMNKVYIDLYKDQYERINWEGDLAFFQEVEKSTKINFSAGIRRWGDVITDFDNSLSKNKDLLAITAYNIVHESRAIREMTEDFGPPGEGYSDMLQGEKYRKICMKNMMGLVSKKEAQDVISGLGAFDKNFIAEGIAEALSETGTLNTKTFEVFYNHIFPTSEYKQSHTGKGDVEDQIKAFTEGFQKYVVPYLEGRK